MSRLISLITLLLMGSLTFVLAQSGSGTGLRGWVADPVGTRVPGATVEAFSAGTGEKRSAVTDTEGYFEIRSLPAGAWRVSASKPGFKTIVRDGVLISTLELSTLTFSLEIGEVQQTVEVISDAEMVSSGSATIVRTLDRRELEALPTSARNFTQLLVIQPGVSADISELLSNNNASVSPSVNGSRTTGNSFNFNGIDVTNLLCCNSRIDGTRGTINEGGGSLSRNIAPAPETLTEVKLQTSLYDAATGRNGGGNFQLVSKSGSNDLHGTAYFFLQNEKFIANDFFFNKFGIERQRLRRNEGGFTIGGPVVIPGAYDGRNKTFFFGSYQRTDASTTYVPEASIIHRMPAALTDDRSLAGIQQFAQSIWDTKALGPYNSAAINATSVALLQTKFPNGQYLIPSGASGRSCRQERLGQTCEIINTQPATYLQDQFSANLDHSLTTNHRLSGKFFFTNQPSDDPFASTRAASLFERREDTAQRTASLTSTHVFGPRLINEFRAGYFYNRNDTGAVPYFNNAGFGIANPLASVRPDLAIIEIRGDKDIGDRIDFGTPPDETLDKQESVTVGDTLSWTKGRHSLRMGGEFRHHRLYGDLREVKNGEFGAGSWGKFLTVGDANPADKNRARQLAISLNYGETVRDFRMSDWAWFVADDWRVTPNFTVNVGLRHEVFGWPSEQNGFHNTYDWDAAVRALAAGQANALQNGFLFASNFNPETLPGAAGLGLRLAGTKHIFATDWNNLMPRIGFAWTPMARHNFVVRGGYGIYYDRLSGAFINSLRQGPPFFREAEWDSRGSWNAFPSDYNVFPVPDFQIGFDAGTPFLEAASNPGEEFEALETQMMDPSAATPYMQQWNLNFQYGFGGNWLLDIGYVGSKGTKLAQIRNRSLAVNVDEAGGFLARAGVPGGGFIGNYYTVENDQFVNTKTPPAGCDVTVDPGACVIPNELRSEVLGFDEDEGGNTMYTDSNSIYNSLQVSLEKRFSSGFMANANYTFARSIDYFSDEGVFQVENDQRHWRLNRGLSDFHRKHRFIFSFSYDLPFRGNRLVSGWSLSGIGTFQSGRPFTVSDDGYSGYLYAANSPRPNLAPGSTHATQTTGEGSVSRRVDGYLNASAFRSSGANFGNLGRNTIIGPAQSRLDLSLAKITRLNERLAVEFRAEAYNATNTPNFWDPDSNLASSSFGQISRMRGGPRVFQFGLKLRY